jgi:hypothetical protein
MHYTKARWSAGLFFLGLLALGGCAGLAPQTFALRDQPPAGLPLRAELPNIPFFPQEDYYCGPAALASALNAAGVKVTIDTLVEQVYLPGRKGSLQLEMLAAARRHGMVAYLLEPDLVHLLREVAAGTPVIALENYGLSWFPLWHYSVLVGYDLQRREAIRHSGLKPRELIPLGLYENLWLREGRWAMVVVPPDRVPATASEQRYAEAIVALEKTGQTRHAHTAYAALVKRWPSSLAGLMGLGNTAHALGDLAGAEAGFRQATLAHPDSVPALNNLAQTLLDRGKFDDALAAAQRAVGLGGPLLAAARATLEEIRTKQRAVTGVR